MGKNIYTTILTLLIIVADLYVVYSMCYGVIFGMAVVTGQRYGLFDDTNHSNLMSKRPALAVTFLSLVGLGAASGYAFLCPNSFDCDEVHSYSTFVPVCTVYRILNNGKLRVLLSIALGYLIRGIIALFTYYFVTRDPLGQCG